MTRRHIIESGVRLSDSVLWSQQRAFFERQGIDAWRTGAVPHYITSNPAVARAYAQVVFGWLRDVATVLDPAEPVYVVELGAGSGRFGYQFLRHFFRLHGRSVLSHIAVRFVMTDLASATVDEWRNHPQLRPWREAGLLTLARFDAEHADTLDVIGSPANPVAFLANYFFDGLPQDAYVIDDGVLYESLVTVDVPEDGPADVPGEARVLYDPCPLAADPYDSPAWNELLRSYGTSLDHTHLLFPVGALRCLGNLSRLSRGRFLLVSGDKGYHDRSSLEGRPEPHLAGHGSVSMMVNYHAIEQYLASERDGELLTVDRLNSQLDICVALVGDAQGDAAETRQAFALAVDELGPDDFYTVKRAIQRHYSEWSTAELVAHLRLSGWDARIFMGCFPVLLERVDTASAPQREELAMLATQVAAGYFSIGEDEDVPFALGILCYGLGRYADAARLLEQSLLLHGADPATLCNLAMSSYELGRWDDAQRYVDETLALDPTYEPAGALREHLDSAAEHVRDGLDLGSTAVD